jgi:hypothetical protein
MAVRVADPGSMYRGLTGMIVEPDAVHVAGLDAYSRRFLRGDGTVLVQTPRGELFVIHARSLERFREAVARAMDRDDGRRRPARPQR